VKLAKLRERRSRKGEGWVRQRLEVPKELQFEGVYDFMVYRDERGIHYIPMDVVFKEMGVNNDEQ